MQSLLTPCSTYTSNIMSANQQTALRTHLDSLEFLGDPATLAALEDAANLFIKDDGAVAEIWAASRDWFLEEWGRDTFISLPGLLLATERYEDARQIFLRFAGRERNGLIPNVIRSDETLYNTADASLLLVHALQAYAQTTQDWQFVARLMPTVKSIISGYRRGTAYERGDTRYEVKMDQSDGLIISPPQATWMDADPSGNGSAIVTPRNGKCVEINALWYDALRFAIEAEKRLYAGSDTTDLEQLANLVHSSFAAKFWNADSGCLYDVIEGDPHGAAIRPNQVLAISHGGDLLGFDEQQAVLKVVERELLTPGGLRTLSLRDSMYRGCYDTTAPMSEKDLAYHQGTVWPWLIGPYADAVRAVRGRQGQTKDAINHEIGSILAPLVQFCLDSEFHSLPEVFSGDPPFEPGGTTSQAWSVAEVLRLLKEIAPAFTAGTSQG